MTLHDCPPPTAALARWLKDYPSIVGKYGHEFARSADEFGLYDPSDLANKYVLDAEGMTIVRRVFAHAQRR